MLWTRSNPTAGRRPTLGGLRVAALASAILVATSAVASPTADWNDRGVGWTSYDEGLARAQREKKPILLVVYTTWCPACARYSRVFHDQAMVMKARDLVMVRIDADAETALAKRYAAPDGSHYVPRTFVVSPDGSEGYSIASHPDPASELTAVNSALGKVR